ncbi:MAG: DUF6456 domain-containing protein [Maritimibacter sp.]
MRALPGWVPDTVRTYLAHTEGGVPLRALARDTGLHPSTMLRQVQRIEMLREDPLVDAAITRIGQIWQAMTGRGSAMSAGQDRSAMICTQYDEEQISQDTFLALKALNEPDCLMVIADGVDEAVVVHNAGGDRPVRRAVVHRSTAESLALREYVTGRQTGRLTRYIITPAGRVELNRLMAALETSRLSENGGRPGELREGRHHGQAIKRDTARVSTRQKRSAGSEAPLYVLARRRRPNGEPWLTPDLIAAAFRFHESYEIARLSGEITRDWDSLMMGRVNVRAVAGSGGRAVRRVEAAEALAGAIRALGPDLSETVILSVCHEVGMEEIEAKLGYPARSGKLVLRIALRKLSRYYDEVGSGNFDMIY